MSPLAFALLRPYTNLALPWDERTLVPAVTPLLLTKSSPARKRRRLSVVLPFLSADL